MSFLQESKHKLIMFGALLGVFLIALVSIIVPHLAASAQGTDSNHSYASLQYTSYGQVSIGISLLTLKNHALTVVVAVGGLVPGSVHAEHINSGICERQIPNSTVYTLNNLVVDKNGNAVAVTVIKNVKQIPGHGWYVNLHGASLSSDKNRFDSLACGNVQWK